MRFSAAIVSISLLTVPRAFLVTDGAFLRQQTLIPIADAPHLQRARFSTAKVLIPSLTVPGAFLLLDSTFLHHWSLIPVTDRPLYVSVHSERASPLPKSHFRC